VRILVTGGSGYLGTAAVAALRGRGHDVVTIGRRPAIDAAVCDLTNEEATRHAVRAVGDIDTVVHLAARAHDFHGLTLDELLIANTTTTRNLVAALRVEGRSEAIRFVHASSVAVYELLDPEHAIPAAEAPYAASKLQAEQVLLAEPFRSLCLLRFALIYDRSHLIDVAKRVFLPGTRLKLRLCPPPVHSLCTLDRAVQAILDAVEGAEATGCSISNVTDPTPIRQDEMASWFPGPAFPVSTSLLRCLADAVSRCGVKGRKVSRLMDKFITPGELPCVAVPGGAADGIDRTS
jgi:nucleoside-diphosphate-sugar epimerase